MNWFFISLIATFFFSTITHIDKYLISRYLNNKGVGALMLFSSLFAVIILPIILFFEKNVFSILLKDMLFLVGVGVLSFLAIFFYFKAITYVDVSTAIPFFQLIPIFAFILGFIFLGELIPLKSAMAGLVIIMGIFTLSFEKKDEKPIVFHKKMVLFMIASSFTYALYEVLFKVVTVTDTFFISLFWQNIGLLLVGLLLYVFKLSYRKDFHDLLKNNGTSILSINFLNEALNTLAVGLIQYATLLVPVVLVLFVNALQPIFVFFMGFLLTIFLPNISKENISKKILMQKMVSLILVTIGTYFLYF